MWKRFEKRLDTEMRFHLDQLTQDYIAQGLAPDEARRRALQEFGAIELAKDEVRDLRPLEWLPQIGRDVRVAARGALHAPGFSLAVVTTLALAIGSAVAVFGLVYAVLLRSLPYPDAERLVSIDNRFANAGGKRDAMHMLQYQEWRKHASAFESLAAYNLFYEHGTFNLTGRGQPERLTGINVTANLLPMLGARPAVGRLFANGEDEPGAASVVVVSYGLWQRRFGADPSIVGQSLIINDKPHTVVGVLAAGFAFAGTLVPASDFDVYLPLVRDKEAYRYGMYLGVLGRLKHWVSSEQAGEQVAALHKAALGNSEFRDIRQEVRPLADRVGSSVRSPLWMLLGAVALLVFTGCANLANLFLARAAARGREMSVRAALGAGRGRLVRQLLTECALLAGFGTVIGIALAALILSWLRGADWPQMPRLTEMGIHWPVAAFAMLTCALTTVLFGLAPALRASRADVTTGLKEGVRGASGGGARRPLRWALVAVQVGLSFVLLAGSGLLLRSLLKVLEVSPGFRPDQVIAMRVDPGERRERGPKMTAFFDDILSRVRRIPGVKSAALAVNLPLDRNMSWEYTIPGQNRAKNVTRAAAVRMVSPGYFRTLGIQMHAGRDFSPHDTRDAPRVVAVNRTLGREIAALRDPVGSKLIIFGREHEVIAVVDDVKYEGLDRESGPEFYLGQSQTLPFPIVDVVVRSALPVGAMAMAVRDAVWAVDPNQAVGKVQTLEGLLNRSLSPRRFFTWILAAFAGFALLLAFAGVYGVVSYGVALRTTEIGIRMALGAKGGDILRLFVGESMTAALLGLTLGVVGTVAFARLIGSQLYGVTTLDPVSFACAGLLVLVGVLAAALFPARRATRMDPSRSLRAE
jgi:predicted permease